MGRFDAKRADQSAIEAKDASEHAAFVVDNSQLSSEARGIAYRRSMNLTDKDRKIAEFGSVVRGEVRRCEAGQMWLQAGQDLYLPMQVAGKSILLKSWWNHDTSEQPVERMIQSKMTRGENRRIQAEVAEAPSTFHSPPEVRPLIPGTGCLYEVVCERLIIRVAPHPLAPMQGTRRKGQILELFDWDEQRQWRRIRTKLDNAWVALDFDQQPLLRPQGVPFSQRPLDPLCQAAREGCAQDVRRFITDGLNVHVRDVDGSTPLMLAAQKEGWRGLVCSVLLLEANADPNVDPVAEDPMTFEIAALEEEKRRAVEQEDYQRAQKVKEELVKLNQRKAEVAKTAAFPGDTAAGELLMSLRQTGNVSATQLLAAFDEVAALPATDEARHLPRRVQALQMRAQESKGAPPSTKEPISPYNPKMPTGIADDETEPWLQSRAEGHLGVLFRVLQTAPVFEEAKMSAMKLGNLRQHQLLEILGYNSTRSFGRVEVIKDGQVEKGWQIPKRKSPVVKRGN